MAADRQDTKDKVIALIAEKLSIDPGSIDESAGLEGLGADSLDLVEIIMKLEEAFNIQISDEDAEKLVTVKDAIEYVQRLRS